MTAAFCLDLPLHPCSLSHGEACFHSVARWRDDRPQFFASRPSLTQHKQIKGMTMYWRLGAAFYFHAESECRENNSGFPGCLDESPFGVSPSDRRCVAVRGMMSISAASCISSLSGCESKQNCSLCGPSQTVGVAVATLKSIEDRRDCDRGVETFRT